MMVADCGDTGSWSTAVFHGSDAWKMLPETVYPGPEHIVAPELDEPPELELAPLLELLDVPELLDFPELPPLLLDAPDDEPLLPPLEPELLEFPPGPEPPPPHADVTAPTHVQMHAAMRSALFGPIVG
jgi:hypothetical protein